MYICYICMYYICAYISLIIMYKNSNLILHNAHIPTLSFTFWLFFKISN